jgi:hypothetical protein
MLITEKYCETFSVDIFVGSEQWSKNIAVEEFSLYYERVTKICQEFCDEVGLCVHIQKVDYVYTQGSESGVKVGLINYPRFPKNHRRIINQALDLGRLLLIQCKQKRITVVAPDGSYLLENYELLEEISCTS